MQCLIKLCHYRITLCTRLLVTCLIGLMLVFENDDYMIRERLRDMWLLF
jgi:hypothetical protein